MKRKGLQKQLTLAFYVYAEILFWTSFLTAFPALSPGLIQGEDKFASGPLGADHVDILAVGGDDLLDDGQAQAGALAVLAPGAVLLVEAVPDLGQALPGNSFPGILDGDKDLAVALRSLHSDGGIPEAELDGVVNEVVEHLLDLAHVRVNGQGIPQQKQLNSDLFGTAGALEGGCRIFDYIVDIKFWQIQHTSLAVEVVQGQQVLGQLA